MGSATTFHDVPLDSNRWRWGPAKPAFVEHLGRPAARLPDAFTLATLDGLELTDGVLELELAVSGERSFPGLGWHVVDDRNYESFFVRPHQVGNDDAIQYTPVTNGLSSWQLYHGPGFWSPVAFPIGAWFTMRVAFAGTRAATHVANLERPALVIDDQKLRQPGRGGGILVAGPGLHVARFAWSDGLPGLPGPMAPPLQAAPGVITAWFVSEPFTEDAIARELGREHRWTRLDAEPSGLTDLARAAGIERECNTVLARVRLESAREQAAALEIGFSDRCTLFLNGKPLFRGDDTYRSRDYRFLGSIGYWDTVHLPLRAGANELVAAVSETFGGWGIQARLLDPAGVVVEAGR